MPSPRDILRRIKSISSTAQITRAMQMVASTKMRRAQQATLMTRPFAQLLYRVQRRVATHLTDYTHPLLEVREVRRRAVVLVATDKGLCGALNSNLFRVAAQFDPATTSFIAVGKRAALFVAGTKRKLAAEFTFTDSPRFAEARPIAAMARDLFLSGEVDEVRVVATGFVNTLTQVAASIEFLPIGEIKAIRIPDSESEEEIRASFLDYTFEPNAGDVMNFLLPGYLNIFIYRVLLESKASEQSARMVAMKSATDNAVSLIQDLKLEYNQRRQSNITTELLDISGGQLGND
jgi:F-type H+-transporting ATPase subunit gamma